METRSRLFHIRRPIIHRNAIAFGFAFVFGVVGLYGLGHVYIGKIVRGLAFLFLAIVPYGFLVLSMLAPNIYPFWRATIAWFLIYLLQLWDLNRLLRSHS